MVNLVQTHGFHKSISPVTPALLRGSVLYDLVAKRAVLPLEHFAVQAFLIMTTSKWVVYFPWDLAVLQRLADDEIRKLIGNGMHLCAVGRVTMLHDGLAH